MAGEQSDAGEADGGDSGSVEVLVVFGKAAAGVDPGVGALDDTASGDDLEILGLSRTLDDLDAPSGIGHGSAQFLAAAGTRPFGGCRLGEDRLP